MPRLLRAPVLPVVLLLLSLCSPAEACWRQRQARSCPTPRAILYQAYYCDGMYLKYVGTYNDPSQAYQECRNACGTDCQCYIFADGVDHQGELCVKYAPPGAPCCPPR